MATNGWMWSTGASCDVLEPDSMQFRRARDARWPLGSLVDTRARQEQTELCKASTKTSALPSRSMHTACVWHVFYPLVAAFNSAALHCEVHDSVRSQPSTPSEACQQNASP